MLGMNGATGPKRLAHVFRAPPWHFQAHDACWWCHVALSGGGNAYKSVRETCEAIGRHVTFWEEAPNALAPQLEQKGGGGKHGGLLHA